MPSAVGVPRHGQDRSVVATPRLGGRIGRYRLCLHLASGGMSTVYLARMSGAVGHHRFVALKCLKPTLAADPAFVEMFLDEARLASLINHPNVCGVIDYQAQGSVSYLVMELMQGQSLAAIRRAVAERSEPLPPAHYAALVARIIADAAEGLHAAHELTDPLGKPLGVVHRDVSPENVFLTYDGNVKVVDFGVAFTSQQHHHTQPGTLKGKYCYLQPEVLKGQKPDRRADVWGLGVVAWELLTHRRLFEAEHEVDALRAVLDVEIAKPSSVRPELPPALDEIVMRALERDPSRRYATAREFGRKLTWFLGEERMAVGLASLADFMEQVFPTGRACARQQLDTVERMHDVSLAPGGEESPTMAGPPPSLDEAVVRSIVDELSGRVPAVTIARTSQRMPVLSSAPNAQAAPTASIATPSEQTSTRAPWRWLAASAFVALAVFAGLRLYPRDQPRPASVAPAAAPACPLESPAPASPAPALAPAPAPAPVIDDDDNVLGVPGELQLTPVRLPNGEIAYRVRPTAAAPTAKPPAAKPAASSPAPRTPSPPAVARTKRGAPATFRRW